MEAGIQEEQLVSDEWIQSSWMNNTDGYRKIVLQVFSMTWSVISSKVRVVHLPAIAASHSLQLIWWYLSVHLRQPRILNG